MVPIVRIFNIPITARVDIGYRNSQLGLVYLRLLEVGKYITITYAV